MDVMNELHLEHDPDDPPPTDGSEEIFWYLANRYAEQLMGWLRLCGLIP